jgi:ABC-type bacteriocin/lantibiotic exporter with double-glycine peptidase domain
MPKHVYRNINVRLTEDEIRMLDEFQERLQRAMGDEFKVTQRTVIVQALKQFAQYLTQMEQNKQVSGTD